MKKIRLVGAQRYHYKGTTYEAGKIYAVKDVTAAILLRAEDTQTGLRFFEDVAVQKATEEKRVEEEKIQKKAKTDEELEAELEGSTADSVIVEADDIVVEDLEDGDLI